MEQKRWLILLRRHKIKKIENLIDKKFGRLTIVEFISRNKYGAALWKCKCICNSIIIVPINNLKSGNTKSCGCFFLEKVTKHGHNTRIKTSRTYKSWHTMIQRCNNTKNTNYKNYGGRGITVCDEWNISKGGSFQIFLKEMGERPKGKSLDRINNDKGYYKENCRWTSLKEQNRNRRDNKFYIFNGYSKILSDWSLQLGIKEGTLRSRIKRGWEIKRAFLTKVENEE